MNTRKQIDVMVALVILTVLALGLYYAWDDTRASDAEERQLVESAERGAKLFAEKCRRCHGREGQGPLEDPGFPGFVLNQEANRPTDPSQLKDKQETFTNTIRCGRVGTLMPAWALDQGGELNEEQIRQLVVLITTNAGNAWAREIEESNRLDEEFDLPPAPSATDEAELNQGACGQIYRGVPAAAATPTAALAPPPEGPEVVYNVDMGDNLFDPNVLVARPGQKVVINLTNVGQAVHNMRQAMGDNNFDTGDDVVSTPDAVDPGATATIEFTIDQVGTYDFRCDFHPVDMTGTIVVLEEASPEASP
jgi:plastocyanin/mono/diheme cytochrome c family protein